MTTKRGVLATVGLPALLLLLSTSRTWLDGRSADPLLGGGAVTATGSEVAPGAVALGIVALAGLVATLTGGPVIRRISAVVVTLSGVGAAVLVLGPLRDPAVALGRVAASGLGRSGVVATSADVSAWAWVALAAAVLLVPAGGLALAASRGWGGLSRRFEVSADDTESTVGPGPARKGPADARRTAWDELTEGGDPTVGGEHPHTPPTDGSSDGSADDAGDHPPTERST